jgi:shikimate kinase
MAAYIFLTGFMGSGKSSLGKELADGIDFKFEDLDAYIEKKTKMSIQTIFDEMGIRKFRSLEKEYLKQILEKQRSSVIALGGGTMCSQANIKLLQKYGLIVYIKLPAKELAKRLENNTEHRPLLRGLKGVELLKGIKKLLNAREKYYKQAHISVNGVNLKSRDLVRTIIEKLHK